MVAQASSFVGWALCFLGQEEEEEEEPEEEVRRSLFRIVHARAAIPNEMGPTHCCKELITSGNWTGKAHPGGGGGGRRKVV